ncbi:hypothetical protein EVG20_g11669 [Dentipellis fragilis]|uniref:Uncharacterized protein n=1 Tax=Dentipellis fragilis TaxID=205917 RepID=A0A4Y9XJR7_9AGAM|nr:hypothetical protein EVG20_g11669 [Dentipellis fragilis]
MGLPASTSPTSSLNIDTRSRSYIKCSQPHAYACSRRARTYTIHRSYSISPHSHSLSTYTFTLTFTQHISPATHRPSFPSTDPNPDGILKRQSLPHSAPAAVPAAAAAAPAPVHAPYTSPTHRPSDRSARPGRPRRRW